jgi:hypothetical protein
MDEIEDKINDGGLNQIHIKVTCKLQKLVHFF